MKRDLQLRIAVAALGVPLCAMVVFAGGPIFAVGLGLLIAIGYWEFAAMFRSQDARPFLLPGSVGAALFPLAVLYHGLPGGWVLGASLLMVYSALAMARVPIEDGPVKAAAITGFGALYIGGLLSFGVPLREDPMVAGGALDGGAVAERLAATLFFFYPVAITWLTDTAAFFGGRAFGRHQLAPKVSPNKTVEGAIWALLTGPLISLAYATWLLPGSWHPGVLLAALFGLVVAGLAIVGDLVESALKRECAVKDASSLLPGHGGLLDRLDSLLWVLPGSYLFFVILR